MNLSIDRLQKYSRVAKKTSYIIKVFKIPNHALGITKTRYQAKWQLKFGLTAIFESVVARRLEK